MKLSQDIVTPVFVISINIFLAYSKSTCFVFKLVSPFNGRFLSFQTARNLNTGSSGSFTFLSGCRLQDTPLATGGDFFCTALLLKLIVVGKLPHWWEIWPRHVSLRSTLINPRHDHFPEDTPCPVREATSYFKSVIIKGRICYYGLSVNGFAIQIPTAFGS